MPELPEVETVRRGLEPALVGARIVRVEARRPDLRFPLPRRLNAILKGAQITKIGRRAKYLLITLNTHQHLVIHLGMSGRLTLSHAANAKGEATGFDGAFAHTQHGAPKHDHVIFHLDNGATLTYNDPRRFGFMDIVAENEIDTHRLFQAIGPEPLGNAFNATYLAARAAGRRTDLKAFLLDQRTVAGLGNIYVCEALFRARLSPKRSAGVLSTKRSLPTARAEALVPAIRNVLEDAITAGGSSLKDYRRPDGALGYFQHAFDVYGRSGEACRRRGCKGTVHAITQAGRTTFYCPKCQR